MKLETLQRSLQAYVLRGEGGIEAEVMPRAVAAQAGQFAGGVAELAGTPGSPAGATATERLSVYAHAYVARLVEVLGESYPALRSSLGGASFDELARGFVRGRPSSHASVRFYGGELAAFLAARLRGAKGAVASDLAAWEWAVAGAFDAADAKVLGPADLTGVLPADWPALRLGFVPSLQRVTLGSNAVAWWQWSQGQQGEERGSRAGGAEQRDGDGRGGRYRTPRPRWRAGAPHTWILWRRELQVMYRVLAADEARALDAAARGESFARVCEQVAGRGRAVAVRAAGLLRGWLEEELIVGVTHGGAG